MFNYEQMMENILAKTGKRPPQQPNRPFVHQPNPRDVNEMPVLAPSNVPMPNAPNIQPEAVNQPRFQAPPPNLEYSASDSRNTQIAELEDLLTNPDRKDDPANQMGLKGRVGHGVLRGAGIGAQSGNVGQAVGGAIGGLLVGIFDKKGEAKRQNQGKLAQLYRMRDADNQQVEEEQQQAMRQAQTQKVNTQTTDIGIDNERAAKALEEKNNQSWVKIFEQSEFNKWRMTNGDAKLSDEGNFRKWKMERGDKDAVDRESFRQWQIEAKKADQELRKQGYDTQIEVAKIGAGSRENVARIGQQGAMDRTKYAAQAKTAFEAFQQANRLALSAQNAEQKAQYQQQAAEHQKEYIRLRAEMDKQP